MSGRPRFAGDRSGAIAGCVAAVLLGVTLVLLSASPTAEAAESGIVGHLRAHRTLTMVSAYLGVIGAIVLVPFVASLRNLVRSDDEAEWRWTVIVLSGGLAIGALLIGNALLAAAAALSNTADDPSAIAALFAAAKVCLSIALMPLGLLMLASAAATSSTRPATQGLIRVGTQIGVLGLVSGVLIFVNNNWLGPGEPVLAAVGLFIALWLIAVAVTIFDGATSPRD